jgi:hypothetical protein
MFNKSFKTNIKSNEYFDEAIIKSQPHGNLYNIIEPIQQCNFPFCMVGKLKIFFKITSTLWKRSECVGTIIGPDVVLTTAHSLTYEHTFEDKSKKYLKPEKIIFFPSVNGEFNPFRPVEHLSLIVSEKYSKIIKDEDRKSNNSDFDEELLDDYGLIILNRSIGEEIIKLYQLDHIEELNSIPFKTNDKEDVYLYDYFVKANENFDKLEKNAFLPNISLISYTKYKEDYLNSVYYPYSSSFKVFKKRIMKKEEEYLKKYLNSSSENSLSNTFEKETNENNKTNVNYDKNVIHVQNNLFMNKNHHCKTSSIQISNNNSNVNSTQTDIRYSLYNQSDLFKKEQASKKNCSHKIKGVDSIIFDEEFSSMFFSEGNSVICEAKGVIDNNLFSKEILDNNLVIRYRLTTLSGQSGSPLFLRIKEKKLENEKFKSKNHPRLEKYYFVGIHCQRPKNILLKIKSLERQNNTLRNEVNEYIVGNRSSRAERTMNSSFLETGFSEYNIGLRIDNTIVKNIVQNILKEKSNLSFFFKKNSRQINYFKSLEKKFDSFLEENSHYVPIRLYVADKIIIQGVIHQERNLEQLYLVGERLFKDIPIRFISLMYKKQKLDYESFYMKKMRELKKMMSIYLKKVKNGIELDDEEDPVYEFEILINFKEYGNYLANNIFLKLEHSSFRLIKNKDEVNNSCFIDDRKHPHLELNDNHKEVCISKLKVVHSSIIEKINFLSEYSFIFGTLYNSVKDRLLERYHIY